MSEGRDAAAPAAFVVFYGRHADRLREALCLALGDIELGTEAAAEALARAREHWPEVSTEPNPAGWTYRAGLAWARTRQARTRPRDRDAAAPVPTRHADLTTRLHRLGVEQRAAVVCRYLLDWSVEETAAVLELPVETVESRLTRALERLAQAVDDA
jgi:RNA polymerase sigma-70 factor (ECF subfamily)